MLGFTKKNGLCKYRCGWPRRFRYEPQTIRRDNIYTKHDPIICLYLSSVYHRVSHFQPRTSLDTYSLFECHFLNTEDRTAAIRWLHMAIGKYIYKFYYFLKHEYLLVRGNRWKYTVWQSYLHVHSNVFFDIYSYHDIREPLIDTTTY